MVYDLMTLKSSNFAPCEVLLKRLFVAVVGHLRVCVTQSYEEVSFTMCVMLTKKADDLIELRPTLVIGQPPRVVHELLH